MGRLSLKKLHGNTIYVEKDTGPIVPDEPERATITFVIEPGTDQVQITRPCDSTIGELPQNSKDGYEFVGWFTNADGSGT